MPLRRLPLQRLQTRLRLRRLPLRVRRLRRLWLLVVVDLALLT
jgi:hypothetical protein